METDVSTVTLRSVTEPSDTGKRSRTARSHGAPDSSHGSRLRPSIRKYLSYAVLTVGALIVLFPLYMTLVSSLLTQSEYVAQPPVFFPIHPQWDAYSKAFIQGDMWKYFVNSIQQTLLIVVGSTVTSVLAAWAFAAYEFPLKRILWALVLSTLLIPFEVTIVVNVQTIDSLGLSNSIVALALPFMMSAFGIFLLRQAFRGISKELREAATLDGDSSMGFLWRVALPLVRPQLASYLVISALAAWNQYLWPLILTTNSSAHRTIQIGLKTLNSTTFKNYDVVLAGAVIASVPVFILMIIFNKQLIRSLNAGAVK